MKTLKVVLLLSLTMIATTLALAKWAEAEDHVYFLFPPNSEPVDRIGVVTGRPTLPILATQYTIPEGAPTFDGVEDDLTGHSVVFTKRGTGAYMQGVWTNTPIQPSECLVNFEWQTSYPTAFGSDFNIYRADIVPRGRRTATVFSTTAVLDAEREGVLTGNSHDETAEREVLFIKKGEKSMRAMIESYDEYAEADRIVNIVELAADPETGVRTYVADLEY